MNAKKVLFIFGTRPEGIKMAPIIKACQLTPGLITQICITGQHREMLQQVLDFFDIQPDFDLQLMQPNQTLFDITANALKKLEAVLNEVSPDVILVQGDTTTAMVGALSGFYKKIRVGHVEAGLRSGDTYSPFPEEVNRKVISTMASFHFAPTELAVQNLQRENYQEHIYHTGNTVIDALLWGVEKVRNDAEMPTRFPFIAADKKLILVTAHRRESFGAPFENICRALSRIADEEDVQIVYPVHLNPNVQGIVYQTLSNRSNIHLIDPVGYPELIWLMDKSYLVLTDSGGIQEEAPSLGKPVLVMREVTERQEGIDAGTALLVGTDEEKIVLEAISLLKDQQKYQRMAKAVNPYGNGTSARQIIDLIQKHG